MAVTGMKLFHVLVRGTANILPSYGYNQKAVQPITKVFMLIPSNNTMLCRGYAARKGTRAKRMKAKVKKEVTKKEYMPYHSKKTALDNAFKKSLRCDDSHLIAAPLDDVYGICHYQEQDHSFADAVKFTRETHHPTVLNLPNVLLYAIVEFNMQLQKKAKFMDTQTRVVRMPNTFDTEEEEKSVLVFCKTPELQNIAIQAGATTVGGAELIKQVQMGAVDLNLFHHVIAHANMLVEIAPLRGLLNKKFPAQRTGNLGVNLEFMIDHYLRGTGYTLNRDKNEQDYGSMEVALGNLDMETEKLEANLQTLLQDVNTIKPKRPGPFMTRCYIKSLATKEKFKINHWSYIGESPSNVVETEKEHTKDEDDDEDEQVEQRTG